MFPRSKQEGHLLRGTRYSTISGVYVPPEPPIPGIDETGFEPLNMSPWDQSQGDRIRRIIY